jgi:hypothetical protein
MHHNNQWLDGYCKTCGSLVIEKPSLKDRDYMNRCSNPNCKHHQWHYVHDDEVLDYYNHEPS